MKQKTLVLKAEKRDHSGTSASVALRKNGRLPVIIYGHKEEPVAVSLDTHNFVEGLHHGHRLMDIQIGSKKHKVLVKDLQYDYLGRDVIHADLVRVDVTERVQLEVPIELKGIAEGTKEGGIIEEQANTVEVECLVTEIPESLTVNIKELNIGDSLHARDVELPENITLVSDPDMLIVTCRVVAETKTTEELEEEVPAEPEVIGEAAEEGAEGEHEQEKTEEKSE